MPNNVTSIAAAPSGIALEHFEQLFRLETDCWDVHDALGSGHPGFVLLDVRSPEHFRRGHIAGALCLPHGKITAVRMDAWPPDTLFVVYCAGPHCNGAARAALRLSRLGRPVKMMIGGITGWLDEGFPLVAGDADV
jgi:rhodanese-related sulfurtransferase